MPNSMTGFARCESHQSWGNISCEIRSVNHRYLEPSIRLDDSLRLLEPYLRERLRKYLSRGKIDVRMQLKTENGEGTSLSLNQALAKRLGELASVIQTQIPHSGPINPMDILTWPGVLQGVQLDPEELIKHAKAVFDDCLKQHIAAREREGGELANLIEQRLTGITGEVVKVRQSLPEISQQHEAKLRARLEALAVEIDRERLAQELIYLAQKNDVAEELDRLETHIAEVKSVLTQSGAIGRRLDFLAQELNREGNTLSSKATSSETTQSAVEIKVFIEQIREQIQNIE